MAARVAKRSARRSSLEEERAASSTSPTNGEAEAGNGEYGLGPPRKRKRRVVSCAECHRRKQKCDRNQPCQACVERKMEASCHYETTAMSHERHHMRVIEAATFGRDLQAAGSMPGKAAGFGYAQTGDSTLGFLQRLDSSAGGSGGRGSSLSGLDILSQLVEDGPRRAMATAATRAAEAVGRAASLVDEQFLESQQTQLVVAQHLNNPVQGQHGHAGSVVGAAGPSGDPYSVAYRYKALIRQLPPWQYVEGLVERFFHDFDWNYYALDQDIFRKQVADWGEVATGHFGTLQAPHQLSPELRAFPALLFQVLAIGLLMLPPGEATEFFEPIRPAAHATLEGLAMDYSETSMGILALLGKRQMSLSTVCTGFLRAAFLKYVALITEAWHALGSAIRDAQEIGLHNTSMDPKPWTQTAEAVLENQWEIQRRRRLWMTLVSWDVQMGVVLGRPTTVGFSAEVAVPVDCILPRTPAERATTSVQPRGPDDPPTPLTRALWSFEAIAPLRAILELEKQGPMPRDFSVVDRLHAELVRLQESIPAFFRLDNPDTRFDDLPECYWLPAIRVTVPQITIFNLIALHRHYIFTRPKSRTESIKACLAMLNIQRVHFSLLKPQQYRIFSLFFGTFDSLVLLATIYILFPKEHPELLPDAIQHFRWSVERFELMADHFALARSALGVLQAIYLRLRKTLGVHFLEGDCAPGLAGVVGSAPIDPLTLSNIDPSLKEQPALEQLGARQDALKRDSISDSAHDSSTSGRASAANGLTPDESSGPSSATSDVAAVGCSGSAAVPAAAAAAADTPALEQLPDLGSLDSLGFGNPDMFPDGFDWTSFHPICPTGDLTYNILMGVSNGGVATVGANGEAGNGAETVVDPLGQPGSGQPGGTGDAETGGTAEAEAGLGVAKADDAASKAGTASSSAGGDGLDLAATAAATFIDGTAVPWQFEGDFASNSLWGLLNSYSPF